MLIHLSTILSLIHRELSPKQTLNLCFNVSYTVPKSNLLFVTVIGSELSIS